MILSAISNFLFSELTKNKYSNYESVLEFLPQDTGKIKNLIIDKEIPIVKTIINYLKTLNTNKIIVSLSGGVDSMVLITIIKYLNYNVSALHINYNNRIETNLEQKFIEEWCYYNSITLHIKSIKLI